MIYKDVLERILKIGNEIRFCTITDILGNVSNSGHHHNKKNLFDFIDFEKYLNCQDCRDSEFYCPEHRIEVEKILEEYYND